MKKRIGAYIRVSTADQSTVMQAEEIRAYLRARSWSDAVFYEDKASGRSTDRPKLKSLLQDARERKIDVIVVWKLDRFARSLKDLVLMLQELHELGVEFISLRDQIDFTTASGRLMVHMIAAFAEFEASIIRERVRSGIANAKARGTRFGRKPTIDIARVQKLRSDGWSLGRIARYLGVSKSGVQKVLSENPVTFASTNDGITEAV
jgi:putative DNA-invertase from lambdoid prophage Rac